MKGIVLAGGSGTRLFPMTSVMSKQLLPVYDKPMICYPLSVFMMLGIQEILIISTPKDTPAIEGYLGNGSSLGLDISYKVQDEPNGIAQAFLLGEDFIGDDSVSLILGDNIFYTSDLFDRLSPHTQIKEGSTILAYHVNDPERFGIVEFDEDKNVVSIEEKPENPKSNFASVGLYFYDNNVVDYAKNLKPSARGELEITDLNKEYLKRGNLKAEILSRGTAWLDAGTPQALLEASHFIGTLEQRQGLKIACLEEIAWRMKFITDEQFDALIEGFPKSSDYRKYLEHIRFETFKDANADTYPHTGGQKPLRVA